MSRTDYVKKLEQAEKDDIEDFVMYGNSWDDPGLGLDFVLALCEPLIACLNLSC